MKSQARCKPPAGSNGYHCAALVFDWGPWSEFKAVNVTGAGSVLEASQEAGVRRFIHISTTDVYGYPNHPVDEMAPFRVRGWPYGDTKIEVEKLAWEYHGPGSASDDALRQLARTSLMGDAPLG